MSRTVHLVTWSPLLFAVFFLIYWTRIIQNETVAFDEFVLEKQANYAADAAVEELLFTGHIETDYGSQFTQVDPDLAVTEFSSILAESFGYVQSDVTHAQLQMQNIKALLVCAWDGIYAYTVRHTDQDRFEFCGSPKIPYFYTANEGVTGPITEDLAVFDGQPLGQGQYALNLGLEWCYRDTFVGGVENKYTIKKTKCPVSKEVQLTAINNEVADILNYTLQECYTSLGQTKSVTLPNTATGIRGQQPVDRITVIGVVTGNATSTNTIITADCIGGAQIVANDPVIGFTAQYVDRLRELLGHSNVTIDFNGAKLFARASFWKKIFNAADEVVSTTVPKGLQRIALTYGLSNPQYFESEYDAAKHGYSQFMYSWEE